MSLLNWLFFDGYVAMLICVGGSGIYIAPWELRAVFQLPLQSMTPPTRATLLNQYRFLKSMELSFGIFAALFHDEIFAVRKFNAFFLTMVFVAVGARAYSIAHDGRPRIAFVAFTVLEFMTGAIVFVFSRTTLSAR